MATKRITNESVRALKASPDKDEFLFDDKLPGFGVKVTPKGSKSFILAYRMGGADTQRRRHKIGGVGEYTADEARRKAAMLAQMIDDGKDPRQLKHERERERIELAFDRYAERFIEEYLMKRWKGGWRIAAGYLRSEAKPHFRDQPITQITAANVAALMRKMGDRQAARRNTFAALRKLFRWAVSENDLTDTPLRYMTPPPAPADREHVLSPSELRLVWHAADRIGYPFGPMVRLLALTGQRLNEVARLQWDELDQPEGVWTLPASRAKNAKGHVVPLSPQAANVLDGVARLQGGIEGEAMVAWPKSGLVFTVSGDQPVSGFSNAKARMDKAIATLLAEASEGGAPCPPMRSWRFHDLRRTVATGYQQQGARFEVTEAMLNHVGMSRKGVAGVYQRHEWTAEKQVEAQKWGERIEALVGA